MYSYMHLTCAEIDHTGIAMITNFELKQMYEGDGGYQS